MKSLILPFLYCIVIGLLCSACKQEESRPNDIDQDEFKGQLVWSEDFTGTSLDTTKWSFQRGGWTSSMVQNCYTEDNVSVSDGQLIITAQYEPGYQCFNNQKDFTSGFVQTKGKYGITYGYVEAKIKLPKSNSTWPAFWMSPMENVYGAWPQSGEIDIMEAKGYDLSQTICNAHWGNSANDKQQVKGTIAHDASEWHIYAVKWTEGKLEFFLDDNAYHTIDNFDSPNATTHPGPFNIPYYIRLNMAVGGTFLTEPHNDATNNIDNFPATMQVEWLKVYEY